MSKITFAEDAWEEYLYWQSQDKKTLKRINKLLKQENFIRYCILKNALFISTFSFMVS